jgi:tetratricopeptide (TPR) repeat protein
MKGVGLRTDTVAGICAALALTAATLVQCTHPASADPDADCTCAGPRVVDATLLAFLSKARAAHHAADLAVEDGDVDLAIAALEPIVTMAHPSAPEASEVIADTRARLADMESDLGRYDRAMQHIDAGLALATAPTHFRGHLLEMKGVVLERRYHTLDATGDTAGAAESKAKALDAFKSAIDVQDQVINDALSHGKL